MFNLIERAYAVSGADLTFDFELFPRTSTLQGIIASGINAVLVLVGAIAVIYLIYGGLTYMTAGGDAEKATKGRTVLVNAIIGIVIVVIALVVVQFVQRYFGTGTSAT